MFDKYDLRRYTERVETPYADNLSSNISRGRQSNSFERFIRTAGYIGFYVMLYANLLVVLMVWSDGSFPFIQLKKIDTADRKISRTLF